MIACILIVDDNATNLKLASQVLELDGYEVVRAIDAEQAVDMVRARCPDLVLMDIALPGMDGLELTRLFKADPALCAMPIVALSAFAMKGDEQKALAAGCDGYISKPINTRTFGAEVGSYLQRVVLP